MQVLTIKVDAVSEGQQVVAEFQVQRQKGDSWNVLRVENVTSGTGESERKIVLQDDERLVVSGRVMKVAVMDPNQNVVQMVDADPDVRAAQLHNEETQRRLNILREQKNNEIADQLKEAQKEAAPKTNLGNPVPPPAAPPPPKSPPTPPHPNSTTGPAKP